MSKYPYDHRKPITYRAALGVNILVTVNRESEIGSHKPVAHHVDVVRGRPRVHRAAAGVNNRSSRHYFTRVPSPQYPRRVSPKPPPAPPRTPTQPRTRRRCMRWARRRTTASTSCPPPRGLLRVSHHSIPTADAACSRCTIHPITCCTPGTRKTRSRLCAPTWRKASVPGSGRHLRQSRNGDAR